MNTYRITFFNRCPTNGVRIEYHLTIESDSVIMVEDILAAVEMTEPRFHEPIADHLHKIFGGTQTLVANHHGVVIATTRK